jgi:hypothetical protein
MKRVVLAVLSVLLVAGCGNSATDSELIGQVKKVNHQTPLICPNYYAADISLGVMRNGVGSMSTEDMWLYVEDKSLVDKLHAAQDAGQPVKVKYDTKRVQFCTEDHWLTSVEVLK